MTPISLAASGSTDLFSAPQPSSSGSSDESFASYLKKSHEDDQQEGTNRSSSTHKRPVKEDKDDRGRQHQESDTSDAAADAAANGQQPQDPVRSLLPSWRASREAAAVSGALQKGSIAADGAKDGEQADSHALPKGPIAFSVTATEKLGQNGKGKHSDANHGDEQHATPAVKSATAEAVQKLQATAPVRNVVAASPALASSSQQGQTAYSTNQISKPAAPAAASQIAEVVDLPQTPQLRPHSIDLKVAGENDSQVDVRISQRAGDVQVTVRTPDGELAQSLRQHLPELSERLAQNGVHGDIWHPTGPVSSSAETDNGGSQSWHGDESNRQQQAREHNQQSNQGQQDSRQSAWLNELNQADKETL